MFRFRSTRPIRLVSGSVGPPFRFGHRLTAEATGSGLNIRSSYGGRGSQLMGPRSQVHFDERRVNGTSGNECPRIRPMSPHQRRPSDKPVVMLEKTTAAL